MGVPPPAVHCPFRLAVLSVQDAAIVVDPGVDSGESPVRGHCLAGIPIARRVPPAVHCPFRLAVLSVQDAAGVN